ncbi:Serine/threonine-protein kinase PknD [Pseudobythopirellula maris]|uniref:Serine/threonine-protein kinase PknD n=1 Tax=Pseudobythopirellula maris TaxID=2527991 RepID=A0A5C5ZTL5_9BACT|nr:NHL repeat-containing protein [Pseudobythopirellula maris]TWT90181.1 Serine/threonine-protein kinase PknD [Pseudobythopirellula maris]
MNASESLSNDGAESPRGAVSRRRFLQGAAACGLLAPLASATGCEPAGPGFGRLDKVWGRHGVVGGRMHKARAMAIDADQRLYLVDFTARILVYDLDGNYLHGWSTPVCDNGRPTGLTYDPASNRLLVADTHYYRILEYELDGSLVSAATTGGTNGVAPGEFGFVTDAVRDSQGCLYVCEYGDNDRVQKFSPDGEFLAQWGSHGTGPDQFKRPQNLLVDSDDRLWVCDACNHRIKVFDPDGKLVAMWGEEGSAPGQMYYPYDIVMDPAGDLYIVEYGNHRVQKFTQGGESLGVWGGQGRDEGQLWDPWALALDSHNRLHVLDTHNNRVQRVVV